MSAQSDESKYVAVTNIPNDYHAADLRAHFSNFVENGSFLCFHYRHRPEKTAKPTPESKAKKSILFCCVVIRIRSDRFGYFEQKYDGEQWTDVSNNYSTYRCKISLIRTATGASRPNNKDTADYVTEEMLLSMPELKPPDLMPSGNVGTPTLVFLDLIQRCLLPDRLVNTLKLKFPKTEGKRFYSNVDYDYPDYKKINTCINRGCDRSESDDSKLSEKTIPESVSFVTEKSLNSSGDARTLDSVNRTEHNNSCEIDNVSNMASNDASDSKILTKKERRRLKKMEREETQRLMNENIEERLISIERKYLNEEDAEEWDRHEAIEDDPSNQERNKERLYEEEIEQPWEKGGPGVVFYTDAIYWQAQEGDFDEQTADDLDVDFSPYEGDAPGDKDIRDFLKIRQEGRFRSGYDKTDRYSIGLSKRPVSDDRPTSFSKLSLPGPSVVMEPQSQKIGQFEIYTRGLGRKIMEKQGWTDGQGLGKSQTGIKHALKGEGQRPYTKKGLGFTKPEPISYGPSNMKRAKSSTSHLITTSRDNPNNTDPKEKLLERQEPTTLKHRKSFRDNFSPGFS